jgi:hypothetical protein
MHNVNEGEQTVSSPSVRFVGRANMTEASCAVWTGNIKNLYRSLLFACFHLDQSFPFIFSLYLLTFTFCHSITILSDKTKLHNFLQNAYDVLSRSKTPRFLLKFKRLSRNDKQKLFKTPSQAGNGFIATCICCQQSAAPTGCDTDIAGIRKPGDNRRLPSNLGDDRFLPHTFQFIIHLSNDHSTLHIRKRWKRC